MANKKKTNHSTKNKQISNQKNELKKENATIKNKKQEVSNLKKLEVKKDPKAMISSVTSSDEMMKLVKIILVLFVIIVVFYGITVIVIKQKKNNSTITNRENEPAVIQYDEILIGTLLDQPREEYYVFIQQDDSLYQSLFTSYMKTYRSKTGALKIYTSNMNDVLNSFYVSETSNLKTTNMKEFRVSDVSLIKIKNGSITESYEGLDAVEEAFKQLVK